MLKYIIAALVLVFGLPVTGETATAASTTHRYIQCDEKEAETALTIVLKFPGAKKAHREKVFLRATRPEDDGTGRIIARMGSGCGPGTSCTDSVLPIVKEDSVEVIVSRSTRTSTAHSVLELTISIPLLIDRKEAIDGVIYTATWAAMKPRPSQARQGSPAKAPSASPEPEGRRP